MSHQFVPAFLCSALALWATGCSSTATSSEGGKGKAAPAPAAVPTTERTTAERSSTPQPQARSSLPQLQGEHHAVLDLADNRLLGHLLREGGLFMPLGHPGIAKYLHFGRPWSTWTINQRHDGKRVALARRTVSWLSFPLTDEQAKRTSHLVLRLKAARPQGLRVMLNDKRLETLRLDGTWQSAKLTVTAGAARAGENRLELHWGSLGRLEGRKAAAAVHWIYLGPHRPDEIAPNASVDKQGRLVLPREGGVAFYLHPYQGTKLQLRFNAQAAAERCELETRAHLQGGGVAVQARLRETGLPAGAGTETFVDLEPVNGQVSRLELWARGEGCRELALERAALVRPGPAPQLRRAPPPKNVLFWMIDNVRADRYSLYNPKTRVTTPVIDKLGKTGTVFVNAYIQGTESRVSHATIWTGLYPKQHRFIAPKAKLSLDWVTLPEAVKQAGLYTAAWIANGFVSKFWGFGEGWDHFRNTLHKGGGLTGKRLADHSIQFIKEQGDKPFYLYVGTIDPHVSWRGRQPWLDRYHPEPYDGLYKKNVYGKDVEKMATGARQVSPEDRKRIVAVYDSTVSYNDHHLGRVLQALKERGVLEQTMVVITADHGEELWDFGRIGHGHSLREPLVAVPLIIHYPPLFGSGVRVEQGVDVAAVMPTILDALGAPIPATVQAESLLPLAQGMGTGYPRPSFASQYELAHAVRLERFKLWIGGRGDVRVFDLGSKEAEREEASARLPLATRWLTDALSTFLTYQRAWRATRWGVASNHRAELAADLEAGRLERITP